MIVKPTTHVFLRGLAVAAVLLGLFPFSGTATAGSYIVAQCSPGVYTGADDAGFTASTTHYTPRADCSPSSPGLQIAHSLVDGETGTVQGGFGAWVWTAPAGTYITGGSTFSRLATETASTATWRSRPTAGASLSYENQNDDQGHESGIPAGNWRFLVARLECTAAKRRQSLRRRCRRGAHLRQAGPHPAHRRRFADHLDRRLDVLGRGTARAADDLGLAPPIRAPGLQSVQVAVNGQGAAGDDLSGSCNPLPGNMTSRLSPCPPSFGKTYTLDTAQAPFRRGPQLDLGLRLRLRADGDAQQRLRIEGSARQQPLPRLDGRRRQHDHRRLRGNHKGERTLAFRRPRPDPRAPARPGAATRSPTPRSASRATPICPAGPST